MHYLNDLILQFCGMFHECHLENQLLSVRNRQDAQKQTFKDSISRLCFLYLLLY